MTSRARVKLQADILEQWRTEGLHDAWTALDGCDAADVARATTPAGASAAPTIDLAAIGRATLYWMINAGTEDLRAVSRYLRLVGHDMRMLYTAPQRAPKNRRAAAPFRSPGTPAPPPPQIFS